MSRFLDEMKVTAKEFKTALQGGRSRLPPGSYYFEIMDAVIQKGSTGKRAGKWIATFAMRVVEGKHKGAKHSKTQLLDTRDSQGNLVGLSVLLNDLNRMGIGCESAADLESAMEEAKGLVVEGEIAKQKNNPQYTNTFINDVYDNSRPSDEEEEFEEEEEVEEPKAKKRGRPKGSKNKKKKKVTGTKKAEQEDDDEFDEFLEEDD